jgi:hypothetical protein
MFCASPMSIVTAMPVLGSVERRGLSLAKERPVRGPCTSFSSPKFASWTK